MKLRASGQNFFITFPGFIIFAHSLFGYKYYVDIETQSRLMDPNGKTLSEAQIVTPYEIRYTSFPRGAATSLIGWLTPGWGILDIIPGALFASNYDKRATPIFIDKVQPSYKAYVSSKIVEQMAGVKMAASSSKHFYKMETVVLGDEHSEYNTSIADNRYIVVDIIKVENGQMIPFESKHIVASDETLSLFNKITKEDAELNVNNVRNILISFGISDMPFLGDAEGVSLYSMRDNKMVSLFQGNGTVSRIAGH
jgi:hypothetical protein